MVHRAAPSALLILAILSFGCAGQQTPPDTRASDETAIRQADTAWSQAAQAKQVDATVSYYDSTGAVYPPNAPVARDKESIRKFWADLLAAPSTSVGWQPDKVEVARSGDLGYSSGAYELTVNDPKGNPVTDRGKYVVVWKKQADGSWKAVADIFNSDLPPAPAQ